MTPELRAELRTHVRAFLRKQGIRATEKRIDLTLERLALGMVSAAILMRADHDFSARTIGAAGMLIEARR